jgi:hypothetical protein
MITADDDDPAAFRAFILKKLPGADTLPKQSRKPTGNGRGPKRSKELLAVFGIMRSMDHDSLSFPKLLQCAMSTYTGARPKELMYDYHKENARNQKIHERYIGYKARLHAHLPANLTFSHKYIYDYILDGYLNELCVFWQFAHRNERAHLIEILITKTNQT